MEATPELCTTSLKCFYEFQTIIAGVFAIFAAIYSARIIWHSAKLPLETQDSHNKEMSERRLQYLRSVLSTDLRLLSARAKQVEGTVVTYKAANGTVTDDTRKKMMLRFPVIVDDWEFMSLLSKEILNDIMELRQNVENHNFDMLKAGGAFGDDNFGAQIIKRALHIQSESMGLSNKVWNK